MGFPSGLSTSWFRSSHTSERVLPILHETRTRRPATRREASSALTWAAMQQASITKCVAGALVSALALSALIGCAVGSNEADVGESDLTTLPSEAGTGDENSVVLPPSTRPKEEQTDPDAGGVDAGGGGGTDAGAGTDAGVDAGVDAGGGGGGVACASLNVCTGATDLGSVSGDTGADVKTAQGSGSQWFKVRVTENDSSVFGLSLLAKAELTSPPGTNFDLFLYLPGGGSGQECSVVSKSSTSTGADSASLEWGEGSISNGINDDRTLTVEVRWVSGTCSPSAKWSLTVRGDTP